MGFQYYETVMGLNIAGNYAAIVHHWGADITGSETPFEIAKDIVTIALDDAGASVSWFQAVFDLMAEDCFISSARARRVDGGGGAAYVTVYPATTLPGTFSGTTDGAQVAGFQLGYTDGGAGLFAKNWIPGVSEEALVAGRFTGAYVAASNQYGVKWLEGMDGATYHYYPYLMHGSPSPSFNRIVHHQLGATPGSIRRRLVPV